MLTTVEAEQNGTAREVVTVVSWRSSTDRPCAGPAGACGLRVHYARSGGRGSPGRFGRGRDIGLVGVQSRGAASSGSIASDMCKRRQREGEMAAGRISRSERRGHGEPVS